MLKKEDLESFVREKRLQKETASNRESQINIYRSGSAPPTIEGSLSSIEGLFDLGRLPGTGNGNMGAGLNEEEIRSNPSYVNYYYSNVNLNPRLPPPLLSREDWRVSQKLRGGSVVSSVVGDRRKGSRGSVNDGKESSFVAQTSFGGNEDNHGNGGVDWGGDGLIGLTGLGLGSRKKSIAEIFQDDMDQANTASRNGSHPPSHNAFNEEIHRDVTSIDALLSAANKQLVHDVPGHLVRSSSHACASAIGASLSRSTTPDPHHGQRVASPHIPPIGVGRNNSLSNKRDLMSFNSLNSVSSSSSNSSEMMMSALSSLNLSQSSMVEGEIHPRLQTQNHINDSCNLFNLQSNPSSLHLQSYLANSTPSPSPSNSHHTASFLSYHLAEHAVSPSSQRPLPVATSLDYPNLNRISNQTAMQTPLVDPLYLQHARSNNCSSMIMDYAGNSYVDLLQKAYVDALVSAQKSQFGAPYIGKSSGLNYGYYGNPALEFGMPYSNSTLAAPVFLNSPVASRNSARNNDYYMRFSPGMRNLAGGSMGSWQPEGGYNMPDHFSSSLLDEFKSNKTKCFELAEISGHVVEFSSDQYGSRYIQQKLEIATPEEKNMVFYEIMPHGLSLMTDVFGNYVIQKFFEHGSALQVRELANQLTGHVLTLSLQMYGCRVIQKALEVVELDQQTKMAAELEGHIMRCVRDQNGNHVIQKCIECIPEDAIEFIISTFYDQVVSLSSHPYGCRVIQRVLEHCWEEKTQQIMMDEILKSVCLLAQDQYGNYVVQHVLEHGKLHERSAIISQLIGKIVQMSQQKFASNVIEKCLTFGSAAERQILVNEMLGTTEENEPLQMMMKDQFANYVVQKVLETCDDQQLELILSRIKVHLNALKKYTYGKHIVARVEKLVAAGERRISFLALQPAAQMA